MRCAAVFSWWACAQGASASAAAYWLAADLYLPAAYAALVGFVACLGRTYEVSQ